MLPSKTKSGLMETSIGKNTPGTPRNSKLGRTPSKSESDTRSPLQSSRLSIDRSPRSVDSKPHTVERRSPIPKTPDKQSRVTKGSDIQEQLIAANEELKKAKESLCSAEKQKELALQELNEAKAKADEANERLKEALNSLGKAKENTEVEKFRAVELEQAGIEAAQQREEVWQNDLDTVRNQHALDISALLSATQELQKVKHELLMTTEAKNTALSHADDAMKIAEINAEKMELLSVEVIRLKTLVDSKVEARNNEAALQIEKLNLDVKSLTSQLATAKENEKKLIEMEILIDGLKIEVTDAKNSESVAHNLVDEWKNKAEALEMKVEEAIQFERSTSESLASVMKQLEDRKILMEHADAEITCLKGTIKSLENEVVKHKEDLDELDRHLEMAKQEVMEMENTIAILKSEIQVIEEEKIKALENEKDMAIRIENLLEEKNKLWNDLEMSKEELEHSKKAMDGLASALHEVSTEARESKERLLTKQAEVTDSKEQIDELNIVIKSTEEKYESLLDDAKDEIFQLKTESEKTEVEAEYLKSEWSRKELSLVISLKQSEEESACIKEELNKIVKKLKEVEAEAAAAKEEVSKLLSCLKEAELQKESVNRMMEEEKVNFSSLKETLLDKENELQSITQENDDLRTREKAALDKIEELTKLLEQVTAKKTEENGELARDAKDYDIVYKSLEIPENAAEEREEQHECDSETSSANHGDSGTEDIKPKEVKVNGNGEQEKPVTVDSMKSESCKLVDKGISPEREPEPESVDDDVDSKFDCESLYQANGITENGGSPPSKQVHPKKKTPLLRKFGSLLKKKNVPK